MKSKHRLLNILQWVLLGVYCIVFVLGIIAVIYLLFFTSNPLPMP